MGVYINKAWKQFGVPLWDYFLKGAGDDARGWVRFPLTGSIEGLAQAQNK